MANLEGMPIGSLPELPGDLQDEDEVVVYRPSTGKAYQANTDLIDSFGTPFSIDGTDNQEINEGDDLNDYITAGNYKCSSASSGDTLSNVPSGVRAFMLAVINPVGGNNYRYQLLISYNNVGIYIRYYLRTGSQQWTDWQQFSLS